VTETAVAIEVEAAPHWETAEVQVSADAALLAGLRNGVEDSYEALIARFQQPVYNLVYRLVANPNDAQDVVQEVFLKVFRNVARFRADSSLRTWIYRIAVNEARNHRRWVGRHASGEVGIDEDPDEGRAYRDTLRDLGPSPFDEARDHETHRLIEEAVRELRPAFRAAVVLRDVEGMRYEEIAEVLDVSLGTVKSRILRGREALRRRLAGQLERAAPVDWKSAVSA
jgi:RNA polymerase sigma-70 factor (ECF subfamily)